MKKKAIYYEDERNIRPVEEFINELDSKTKAKVLARIEFLEERWQELRRPYVDSLEEGLFELRVIFSGNQIRVIYAYMLKAKNRMNDFQMRYNEGKIKLPKFE